MVLVNLINKINKDKHLRHRAKNYNLMKKVNWFKIDLI